MTNRAVLRNLRPWCLASAVAGTLFIGAAPATAASLTEATAVGPNQHFIAVVNGRTEASRIAVTCDGPIDFVATGHPIPGQTLEVRQVFTAHDEAAQTGGLVGFTGSAAKAIGVRLDSNPVLLSSYQNTVRIPTDILVPCEGTRTVPFEATPASSTAQAATITVTFVKS